MNENKLETQEEQEQAKEDCHGEDRLAMTDGEGTVDEPVAVKSTEGETKVEGRPRLSFVPNRHDRRKAAAIARKEARRKGKK